MSEAYKISIVVPVYNVEGYLDACVASLLRQTYENKEILLIDDGSTDQSGKLCDQYAQSNPEIRVVHKENGGLISAWKRGVEEAQGDYITFVDSDDTIDANMLAEMAMELTGSEEEIITSDYVIVEDNGKRTPVWQSLRPGSYEEKELISQVWPKLLGQEHRYVHMSRCMKLIPKAMLVANYHYCDASIRMGEDVTILLPVLLSCKRLVVMDHKAYYNYLYLTESMAHKYDKGMYENNKRLYAIIQRIIEDKTNGVLKDTLLKQAKKEYLLLLLLVLKDEARGNPTGYANNIRTIAKDQEIKALVKDNPLALQEKSNKLLYLALKYPNWLTLHLLRLAMIIFYRLK